MPMQNNGDPTNRQINVLLQEELTGIQIDAPNKAYMNTEPTV